MIFVGDIASPTATHSRQLKQIFRENQDIFAGKTIVANLEGLIDDNQNPDANTPVLYNHSSVLDSFDGMARKVLCLANNHVLDLPEKFEETKRELNHRSILFAGTGLTKREAEEPVIFTENENTLILFNACFDFLLYNHKNPSKGVYVAVINELKLIEAVRKYRNQYPAASITFYFHWSLDHETLPYPMYRLFSRKLIDEGADIIVGAHSHCVQGGEKYKNGYIVYGLGNFFLPQNFFAGGKLKFPESSKSELVLDWDCHSKEAICHWFRYKFNNDEHTLELIKSEPFEQSEILKEFTPYANMSQKKYIDFFKKNRKKKILIPLYLDYRRTLKNKLDTILLKQRARFARFLAKYNIIQWQK